MIEKVRTGQSVELKASTWNSFINAANYVNSIQQNSTGKPHQSGLDNLVLVKNTTGRTYPQFAAMGLSGIVLRTTNEEEFKSRPPVFSGTQIATGNENLPFAILLEPLQTNQIGKAMVLGVTQAQVYINAAEDQFAIPKPDSYRGEMQSSTSGIARILWKAGSSGLQWCVLQLGGAGGGGTYVPPSYNGFFTLKDVSTFNNDGTVKEFRVAVCDGETWDPVTETSGNMSAVCNTNYHYIKSTIFTVSQGNQYISIKYRLDEATNSNVLELVINSSLSSGEYLIGELKISDSKLNIIQRHTVGMGNGVPRLWLYSDYCSMRINE